MNTRESYKDLLALAAKYVAEAEKDAAENPTSDSIQVVIVEPNKEPYKEMIPNTLQAFNDIVGGYIENIFTGTKTAKGGSIGIVLNEEGKLIGLPFNRRIINFDIIAGTFFITAYNLQGDNVSLSDQDAEKMIKRFKNTEVYI